MQDDLEVEARTEHVGADEAPLVGLGERLGDPLGTERELAADVDERGVALDGERADHHALDELVRVALEEHVVLEGGRLALVGVDAEVPGEDAGRQERPLLARTEPGPAPTPQPRGLDLLLADLRGGHAERPAQALVATRGQVALDGVGVVGEVAQALGDDSGLGDGHPYPWLPETVRGVRRPDL